MIRSCSISEMTVNVKLATATAPVESVARTTNGNVPKTVGVPEIRPDALSESPAGSEPETSDHEYGGLPFAVDSCIEYGWFLVPLSRSVVVSKIQGSGRFRWQDQAT